MFFDPLSISSHQHCPHPRDKKSIQQPNFLTCTTSQHSPPAITSHLPHLTHQLENQYFYYVFVCVSAPVCDSGCLPSPLLAFKAKLSIIQTPCSTHNTTHSKSTHIYPQPPYNRTHTLMCTRIFEQSTTHTFVCSQLHGVSSLNAGSAFMMTHSHR